jgi:hypothetical protein
VNSGFIAGHLSDRRTGVLIRNSENRVVKKKRNVDLYRLMTKNHQTTELP